MNKPGYYRVYITCYIQNRLRTVAVTDIIMLAKTKSNLLGNPRFKILPYINLVSQRGMDVLLDSSVRIKLYIYMPGSVWKRIYFL